MAEDPKKTTEEEKAAEEKRKAEEAAKKVADAAIAEAAKEYGIKKEFIFSSSYDPKTKTATILTNGGTRIRYKKGDKVKRLDEISITGINPAPKSKKLTPGPKEGKE